MTNQQGNEGRCDSLYKGHRWSNSYCCEKPLLHEGHHSYRSSPTYEFIWPQTESERVQRLEQTIADLRLYKQAAERRLAAVEAKAALADWLADQYKVVQHLDEVEQNGYYAEIVTLPEYEDREDVMYDWRERYDAVTAQPAEVCNAYIFSDDVGPGKPRCVLAKGHKGFCSQYQPADTEGEKDG